ncbi:cupin domain-containing protein [Microbacterium aureliae]
MDSLNLTGLVTALREEARAATTGRAARTVFGGREHRLRQTVMALTAGTGTGEHESPGEATLQVLSGTVRVSAGDETWEGAAGDHLALPRARHSLDALTDAVVILTVATV